METHTKKTRKILIFLNIACFFCIFFAKIRLILAKTDKNLNFISFFHLLGRESFTSQKNTLLYFSLLSRLYLQLSCFCLPFVEEHNSQNLCPNVRLNISTSTHTSSTVEHRVDWMEFLWCTHFNLCQLNARANATTCQLRGICACLNNHACSKSIDLMPFI